MSEGRELTPAQRFNQQLDAQVANFRALLPSHIPVERFKRTVVMAISQNPDLMNADRRSFFNAAQKCAGDGLLPDSREAALVIFNTKVKEKLDDGTSREVWVPAVQYMPMVQGIRKRMRNSGEVLSAEAHVVYRNDKFVQHFGDDGGITHEPPPLGQERGDPVGAYAIIKLKSGEILREVMDRAEIERVRNVSRAKDGSTWKLWWGEMARKTVLRRCAKAAPNSAEMDTLLARDDEPPELPRLAELEHDPEPPRRSIAPPPEPALASYVLIDGDGEEHEYTTPDAAYAALVVILKDARRRGGNALRAASENNEHALRQLDSDGREDLADRLREDYLDPFGLEDSKTEQDQPHDVAGALAGHGPSQPSPGQGDLLPEDAPNLAVPLPPIKAGNWQHYANMLDQVIAEGHPHDAILAANAHGLESLSRMLPAEHKRLMVALSGKEAA